MKRPRIPLLFRASILGLTLMAVAPNSQAAFLLGYNFTSSTNTNAPSTVATNVSGSLATWNGMTGGFSSSSGTAFANSANTPAAFSSTAFIEFTITADSGYLLNLDNFVFDLGGTNSSGTLGYVVSANVRSNAEATDYSTDLSMTPGNVTTASLSIATSSTAFTAFTVNLGGTEFDALSSLTLRIYPFDDRSSTSNFLRLDNFVVNGTVAAVPEPNAWTLLMLGSTLGFCLLRNRRGRNSLRQLN